jgi:hypothetical protein
MQFLSFNVQNAFKNAIGFKNKIFVPNRKRPNYVNKSKWVISKYNSLKKKPKEYFSIILPNIETGDMNVHLLTFQHKSDCHDQMIRLYKEMFEHKKNIKLSIESLDSDYIEEYCKYSGLNVAIYDPELCDEFTIHLCDTSRNVDLQEDYDFTHIRNSLNRNLYI